MKSASFVNHLDICSLRAQQALLSKILHCSQIREHSQLHSVAMSSPAKAPSAGELLGEQQAPAAAHPHPPYTEADDVTQGLKCYFPGCDFVGHAWDKIADHVRNKHKVRESNIKGSYLHRQARIAVNKKRRDQYTKASAAAKKQKVVAVEGEPRGGVVREGAACPDQRQHSDELVQPGQPSQPRFQWVSLPCLVKCTMDGKPVEPLEVLGLATDQMDDIAQDDEDAHAIAATATGTTAGDGAPPIGPDVACAVPEATTTISRRPTMHLGSEGRVASSSSGLPTNPMKMLTDIHAYITDQQDTTKWRKALPDVRVKQEYCDHEAPIAKGEGVVFPEFHMSTPHNSFKVCDSQPHDVLFSVCASPQPRPSPPRPQPCIPPNNQNCCTQNHRNNKIVWGF